MINIKINDDYKITSDKYNFILQKKRVITDNTKGRKANPENIGKVVWVDEGYYSDIKHLLKNYASKEMLNSEAKSIQELFDILKDIEKTIERVGDNNRIDLNNVIKRQETF